MKGNSEIQDDRLKYRFLWFGFPGGSDSWESACNAGDPGSVPG